MTIAELYRKGFQEAASELSAQNDCITTYEALKDFAKYNIDRDNFFLAEHILHALQDASDYYDYDYCMGTLDTPAPLRDVSDLKDYCEQEDVK